MGVEVVLCSGGFVVLLAVVGVAGLRDFVVGVFRCCRLRLIMGKC